MFQSHIRSQPVGLGDTIWLLTPMSGWLYATQRWYESQTSGL